MSPKARTAFGAALVTAATAGAFFLVVAIRQPYAPDVRGFLLGLTVGVFGVAVFVAGYLFGKSPDVAGADAAPSARGGPPTKDEAKFWLQRFLEEHQKREDERPA